MSKIKSYIAFNRDGLCGVDIAARNRKQALQFARDIHGKGAKVEMRRKIKFKK